MHKPTIGTCKHCGRQNTRIERGYCRKHNKQLKIYGKFLDCNPRLKSDPNEFIYDENLNCYKIILYDNQNEPISESLIDKEDYDILKDIKWHMSKGYCSGRVKNKEIELGRYLLELESNKDKVVIHRNGNKLDNRRDNLFIGTYEMRSIISNFNRSNTKSGITGVYKQHGKYQAFINIHEKKIHLGTFTDKIDAVCARRIAEFYLNYDKILYNIFPLYYPHPEGYYLDINARSKYDKNEYIFHYDYNYCEIILYDKNNIPVTSTIIDIDDYDKVKDYKWGYSQHDGYVYNSTYKLRLHRLIMDYYDHDMVVDHKNRNRLDNRKDNLRIVPPRINAINSKTRFDSTSGLNGVSYDRKMNKYESHIGINNKKIHLGYHETKEEAYITRQQADFKYGYAQIKGSPILYIPDNMYYDWKNNVQFQQQEEKKLIKPLIYKK